MIGKFDSKLERLKNQFKSNLQWIKYWFSFHTSCPILFAYINTTLSTLMDTNLQLKNPIHKLKNRGANQHSSQGFSLIQVLSSIQINFSVSSEANSSITDSQSTQNQYLQVTVLFQKLKFDFIHLCIFNMIR